MSKSNAPIVLLVAAVLAVAGFSYYRGLNNAGAAGGGHGVPAGWRADADGALKDAAAAGKPTLLYFTASWCGPCQKMKSDTLPNAQVVEALEGYVPVMVDVDRQRGVASRYGIRSVPTFIAVGPDGSEIKRASGYRPPGAFIDWLR